MFVIEAALITQCLMLPTSNSPDVFYHTYILLKSAPGIHSYCNFSYNVNDMTTDKKSELSIVVFSGDFLCVLSRCPAVLPYDVHI